MPIPTTIDDLSPTAASNSPAGSDSPVDGDNFLRAHASFIALLRDKLDGTDASGTIKQPIFSGTASGTLHAAYLTAPTLDDPVFSGTASGSIAGLSLSSPTIDDPVFSGTASGTLTAMFLASPRFSGTAPGEMTWESLQSFSAGVKVGNDLRADPTTLDWYQEGTFTPGVSFGGGTTGITYADQDGVFTRIGDIVHFTAKVTLSNKGSSTGAALLTGLPFTAAKDTPSMMIGAGLNLNGALESFAVASSTTVSLRESSTVGGGGSALGESSFNNNSVVYVAGAYKV